MSKFISQTIEWNGIKPVTLPEAIGEGSARCKGCIGSHRTPNNLECEELPTCSGANARIFAYDMSDSATVAFAVARKLTHG